MRTRGCTMVFFKNGRFHAERESCDTVLDHYARELDADDPVPMADMLEGLRYTLSVLEYFANGEDKLEVERLRKARIDCSPPMAFKRAP